MTEEAKHMREITKLKLSKAQSDINMNDLQSELAIFSSASSLEKSSVTKLRQNLQELNAEFDLKCSSKDEKIEELSTQLSQTASQLENTQYKLQEEVSSAENDLEINTKLIKDLQDQLIYGESKLSKTIEHLEFDNQTLKDSAELNRIQFEKKLELLYSQNSKLKTDVTKLTEQLGEYEVFIRDEISSVVVNRKEIEKAEVDERTATSDRNWFKENSEGLQLEEPDSPASERNAQTVDTSSHFVKSTPHQHKRNASKQRDFFQSTAPALEKNEDTIVDLSGHAEGSKKYQAVRMGLSLLGAQLGFTTQEFQCVFDYTHQQHKLKAQRLSKTERALELAIDEKLFLQRSKVALDRANASAVQREKDDEKYISKKEVDISRVKNELKMMRLDHTDVTEEFKQAVAANEMLNITCKQLQAHLEEEKKEKAVLEKKQKMAADSLQVAREKLYVSENARSLKEQELSVVLVERDELAAQFYKIGSSVDEYAIQAEVEMKSAKEGKHKKKGRRESMIVQSAKMLGLRNA